MIKLKKNPYNQNAAWDQFKAQYKSIDEDISIQLATKAVSLDYLKENHPELFETPESELRSKLNKTISELQIIRSVLYHNRREEAFKASQRMQTAINADRDAKAREQRERDREKIAKTLRGAQKRVYKATGLLPNEVIHAYSELLKEVELNSNREENSGIE